MRLGIIIAAVASAILATTSPGYAQDPQSSSPATANRATTAEDDFWPNARQESRFPIIPAKKPSAGTIGVLSVAITELLLWARLLAGPKPRHLRPRSSHPLRGGLSLCARVAAQWDPSGDL